MRDTVIFAVLVLCGACGCAAQEPAKADKAKEATGGVTGHVLCGDTNLPARLASVLLQPAYEAVPVKPKRKPGDAVPEEDEPRTPAVSIAQTLLDGSHTINGVKPGKYYVIVEKVGYLLRCRN